MTRRTMTALAALLMLAGTAHAGPPTTYLQEQVKAVRSIIAQKAEKGTPQATEADQKLMAIIGPVMEFDKLSEKALRKHWPTLSADQRNDFITLFRELVFRSYLKRVRSANEDYTIAYEGEEKTGPNSATVSAVAKTKKAEIELVFHLEGRPDNKYVAADVVIDEVSLVENYREQFNKIVADEGFPALLDKMRKKLKDLGAEVPPTSGTPAVATPTK